MRHGPLDRRRRRPGPVRSRGSSGCSVVAGALNLPHLAVARRRDQTPALAGWREREAGRCRIRGGVTGGRGLRDGQLARPVEWPEPGGRLPGLGRLTPSVGSAGVTGGKGASGASRVGVAFGFRS